MSKLRLNFLRSIFSIAMLGLVGRVYYLSCHTCLEWMEIAKAQHFTGQNIKGSRGSLYDRKGRILAVSVESLRLAVDPRRFDFDDISPEVIQHIDPKRLEMAVRERQTGRRFFFLNKEKNARLYDREALSKVPGLQLVSNFKRVYPHGSVAAPVLGMTGHDRSGLSGLELRFNSLLSAEDSKEFVRRDALGNISRVYESEQLRPVLSAASLDSKRSGLVAGHSLGALGEKEAGSIKKTLRDEGSNISLSIDLYIQKIVENELELARINSKAQAAYAVMMDADTGEIVSLAQSKAEADGKKSPARAAAFEPIQGISEPGSTIKPLIVALALQEGIVSPSSTIDCESGEFKVGSSTIRDIHPEKVLSLEDIIARSSNICSAKLGLELGRSLDTGLTQIGFGQKTGVELPGESSGMFAPAKRGIALATRAFGHGIGVTAVQMVRAWGSLANGGWLVAPSLLKNNEEGTRLKVFSTPVTKKVAQYTSAVVHGESGTGKLAAVPGYRVHGKTGTAEKVRKKGRGYDSDRVLASFIGYLSEGSNGAPRKNLVLYVGIDEPGVMPRYGGTLAAPVFSKVMEKTMKYLSTTSDRVILEDILESREDMTIASVNKEAANIKDLKHRST